MLVCLFVRVSVCVCVGGGGGGGVANRQRSGPHVITFQNFGGEGAGH